MVAKIDGPAAMTELAYPAARVAAQRIVPHFARDLDSARERGQAELGPLPDLETMEAIIGAAFWASLRREEGYWPQISLAFVPPGQGRNVVRFEQPLPIRPEALVRVAPAVERPGIHLGVWREGDEMRVWGATREIPPLCFVLEVVAPGLLVIKHRRGEDSGKFVNVAVLEGEQIKILDRRAAQLPGCPNLVTGLLEFDSPGGPPDPVNVLVELAVSMRAHRHGGTLLVVPAHSEAWRESIVRPIPYAVSPPFSRLSHIVREERGLAGDRAWQEGFHRAIDAVAGLTAVDGATVISDRFDLLAFGAKIRRREGWEQVEQVIATEPIEGAEPWTAVPSQLGGTRHMSAAQFAHDQRDALALVASQEGRFTAFTWSDCEGSVHAHRIETLLL